MQKQSDCHLKAKAQDVVVCLTVNNRLGIEGFLRIPGVPTMGLRYLKTLTSNGTNAMRIVQTYEGTAENQRLLITRKLLPHEELS